MNAWPATIANSMLVELNDKTIMKTQGFFKQSALVRNAECLPFQSVYCSSFLADPINNNTTHIAKIL